MIKKTYRVYKSETRLNERNSKDVGPYRVTTFISCLYLCRLKYDGINHIYKIVSRSKMNKGILYE